MRPKAAGHVWACGSSSVGSVMFLAIALWVIVRQCSGFGLADMRAFMSSRAAGRIVGRRLRVPLRSTWMPQKGGDAGDHAEALRYTTMALALDPEQATMARRACLSLIAPDHKMAITDAEQGGVLDALLAMEDADHRLTELQGLGGLWRGRGGAQERNASALLKSAKRSPLKQSVKRLTPWTCRHKRGCCCGPCGSANCLKPGRPADAPRIE